jgi:hypothetical protein
MDKEPIRTESMPVRKKDFSLPRPITLEKGSQKRLQKMEDDIITELLQNKLRSDGKRVNENSSKIDRIGSFLRKEGKAIKLPLINYDRTDEKHS